MRASRQQQTGNAGLSAVCSHFELIGWGPVPNEKHDLGTDLLGPGLGVTLDPDRFALYAEAHRREGDISIYAEDEARSGIPPVKSQW